VQGTHIYLWQWAGMCSMGATGSWLPQGALLLQGLRSLP
jgi:hypothetical protein